MGKERQRSEKTRWNNEKKQREMRDMSAHKNADTWKRLDKKAGYILLGDR